VIVRLFRRVHAYADAHGIHGKNYGDITNDFFAIGPAVEAMLKTRESFPDLLLPSDEVRWEAMIKKVRDFWLNSQYKKYQEGLTRMGRYANRDLAVANILLACGLYLNDEECLDAARKLVMAQRENIYPDGGFAYINSQNESCNYHWACTMMLTRYYHLSGQKDVLELVKKSQWYAPLSNEPGAVAEFWTSPSWKHSWNTGTGLGGETVVSLTGNRYERGLMDHYIARRGAAADPQAAMWYRGDIKAAPLPDNYIILDRNIQGPRGRFGRFSYAANLRKPDDSEPGNATVMGAMTIEKEGEKYGYPLEAVLANIMPRVFVETTPDDKHKRPDWAYLTCRDESGVSMGRDWCALHTSYQLHTFGSSRKGREVPWEGSQIWLGADGRLFGLLEIAPQGEQDAFEVALSATLGVGGCGEQRRKDLVTHAPHHWSLGSLNLAILKNNFESVRVAETKIRISPASWIVCSTRPINEPISDLQETRRGDAPLHTFAPDKPHYAVVEVFADEAASESRVERIAEGALSGLSVRLDEASYTLLLNRGYESLVVDLSQLGLEVTGGWVHYPRSERIAPKPLTGNVVSIPSGQHRVILSGMPPARASQGGWENFKAMIRERESHQQMEGLRLPLQEMDVTMDSQ
jgi:hypothetical protein